MISCFIKVFLLVKHRITEEKVPFKPLYTKLNVNLVCTTNNILQIIVPATAVAVGAYVDNSQGIEGMVY